MGLNIISIQHLFYPCSDDEQASRMSGVNGQSHSGYGAQGGHSFVSTTYQCGSGYNYQNIIK